jgi:hypothetical protein
MAQWEGCKKGYDVADARERANLMDEIYLIDSMMQEHNPK